MDIKCCSTTHTFIKQYSNISRLEYCQNLHHSRFIFPISLFLKCFNIQRHLEISRKKMASGSERSAKVTDINACELISLVSYDCNCHLSLRCNKSSEKSLLP